MNPRPAVWDGIRAFLVVVLLVLLALLVVLSRAAGRTTETPGALLGGAEGGARAAGHAWGRALHEHARSLGPEDSLPGMAEVRPPEPRLVAHEAPGAVGGRPKKKRWDEYATWGELADDPRATAEYFREREGVLEDLNLDWSDVTRRLAPKVEDNREWAGRINLVGGKPKVVQLVASPLAIGEGVGKHTVAMVPGDVVDRLARKPSMFMFHTHPGSDPAAGVPSDVDVATSLYYGLRGWGAGHLVVARTGVTLYGPGPIFSDVHKIRSVRKRELAYARKIYDAVLALSGRRGWVRGWSLQELQDLYERLGVMHIVFPNDRYAASYYRYRYQSPEWTDFEFLDQYRDELAHLERAATK